MYQLSLIPKQELSLQKFVKPGQRKKILGFLDCGYEVSNVKEAIAGGITFEVYGTASRSEDGRIFDTYWAEFHLNKYGDIQKKRILINNRTYTDHQLNPIKREPI